MLKIKLFALMLIGCLALSAAEKQTTENVVAPAVEAQVAENSVTPPLAPEREGVALPYEPLNALAKRMRSRPYNSFENPTGIHFRENEIIAIELGDMHDEKIELVLHDFGTGARDKNFPNGKTTRFPLSSGKNTFTAPHAGLTYLAYYSPNFKTAAPIEYKLTTGTVNGVFRAGDDNATWKKILDNATGEFLDLVGKYVHLVFPVADLRAHADGKGQEILQRYDEIINFQREMMGLRKYGEDTPNRQFGRVVYRGYMFADNFGTGIEARSVKRLVNPQYLYNHGDTIWGIAHEFGHTNQMRPTFCWAGLTEVTNNLFSAHTNYALHPQSSRLEREVCDAGDGRLSGARYNAFFQAALLRNEPWLFQIGPDSPHQNASGSSSGSGDFFLRLIPLWQLYLYYQMANKGNAPELFADLYQRARQMDDTGKHSGDMQIAFMKNCIDLTRENLAPYFVAIGMASVVDREIIDYGKRSLTITPEQVAEVVAYGQPYHAPKSPVIYYLSANSLAAFKHEKPVSGTYGEGVSEWNKLKVPAFKIEHKVWQNVVAFETYQGDKMARIAVVGAGFPDNSATIVAYPNGATRIEAVAWDGTRTLVYGTRESKARGD